jgi:hypothetical protein
MNIRIDSCSRWDCEIDFFPLKLIDVIYRYVENLEKLKELVKGDMVWPALIDNYEKWLKDYKGVVDLGYLVFFNKGGKIERIVGIHIYYSAFARRPILRLVEIAEFRSESFDDDDD